jgi:hypothetical protein
MLKIILTILLHLPVPAGVSPAAHAAWVHRVAPVIVEASHGDPATAAYLLSLGRYESDFAERIQAGDCHKHKGECDGGQAHSIWQMHPEALPPGVDPVDVVGTDEEHLQAAADAAARRVRQVRKMCGERPGRVFGGYAKHCAYVPHKAAERIQLYRLLLSKLQAHDK